MDSEKENTNIPLNCDKVSKTLTNYVQFLIWFPRWKSKGEDWVAILKKLKGNSIIVLASQCAQQEQ